MGARRGPSPALWVALPLALAVAGCEGDQITIIPGEGIFAPSPLTFGERAIGATHEREVTLTMPGGGDTLQIVDVRFEPATDVYAARLASGGVLTRAVVVPGKPLAIRVLFAPREPGSYDGSMLVVFQDQRGVQLNLVATGADMSSEDLVIRPASVQFNNAEIGRDLVQVIEIQNNSNRVITISDVWLGNPPRPAREDQTDVFMTGEGGRMPFRGPVQPGLSVRADVHFKPAATGPFSDSLVLLHDTGQAPLPVSGTGVAVGSIRCEPRILDFGPLVRGQSRDLSFSCTAQGGGITLGDITLSGTSSPLFMVVNKPAPGLTLGGGQSTNVGVRFTADGLPKIAVADVVINSDLGPVDLVRVTGQVDPPPVEARDISVTANWDTLDTDVDLHMVRLGAQPFEPLNDCYYMRKNPDWGTEGMDIDDPYLDRDDVDGLGPEEINLTTAREGRYDIYGFFNRVPSAGTTTNVTVELKMRGNTVRTHVHHLASCGEMWHFGSIIYDVPGGRFQLVDTVQDMTVRADCP